MLIVRHCPGSWKTKNGKIDIKTIRNLPLRTIFHTMARIVGAQALHKVTKSNF